MQSQNTKNITNELSVKSAASAAELSFSLEEQLAVLLAACVQRDVVDPVRLLRGEETRTTLMIRRLPRSVTEADLFSLLGPSIDCVYLPLFRGHSPSSSRSPSVSGISRPSPAKNRGFGFVNFVSPVAAAVFVQSLSLYGDVFAKSQIVFAHIQGKQNMLMAASYDPPPSFTASSVPALDSPTS